MLQVRRVAGELTEVRGNIIGVLTQIPTSKTEDQLIWKGGRIPHLRQERSVLYSSEGHCSSSHPEVDI